MGLFSFLHKNKQESTSASTANEGAFSSRAEEESNAIRGRGKRKQSSAPVDPVLPEKKRARRRLVGAIALVLAVIIGLPMILDSEPKPLADDIAIQIPSKDKTVPSAGHNKPEAASSSNVTASASLDKKEELVETPIASGPSPAMPRLAVAAPVVDSKPVEPANPATADKPAPNPQAVIKAVAKPEEKPAAKIDPKAALQAAEKADDAARAKAILEGKPEVKASADKKASKFVVQVAALATQEKVNELQGKLKDAGIKSYTQKVATESGERTRIRIGPFTSKEEADKLRAKLSKLGLNGTLVPLPH